MIMINIFERQTTDCGGDLSYLSAMADDGKFPNDVLEGIRDKRFRVGVLLSIGGTVYCEGAKK